MSNMASKSPPTKEQSTFIAPQPGEARSTADGLHRAAEIQSTADAAQPDEGISVEDDQRVRSTCMEMESS